MSVNIGCYSGFWGDSMWGAAQLVHNAEKLDFLIGDYLAEVTMGILAKSRGKASGGAGKGGFVAEFAERVWKPLGAKILERKIRVITNAGGMNPLGLKALVEDVCRENNWRCVVAAVYGDDVTDTISKWEGVEPFRVLGEVEATLEGKKAFSSANVYFGAMGIAEALRAGADVIVTGRVVDSALALGPLIAHFGWDKNGNWDLLARGSVIGHLLECGCHATGGNFTDWRQSKEASRGWQNVGFPIAECFADGSAVLHIAPKTGGLVTVRTMTEQMLYEIGDPSSYLLPDVTVDFTTVRLEQVGPNRVRVSGASGRAPPNTLKVCVTQAHGYLLVALLLIPGYECQEKARAVGEAILGNANAALKKLGLKPIVEYRIDTIGGGNSDQRYDECVLRMAFAHSNVKALQVAGLEIPPAALSMAPGISGVGATGRAAPSSRMHQSSLLAPRSLCDPLHSVVVGAGNQVSVPTLSFPSSPSPPREVVAVAAPSSPAHESVEVPLWQIAFARSGDKGDSANIGVAARSPQLFPYVLREVTSEKVSHYLQSLGHSVKKVDRFPLPLIDAVNFVVAGVLGGGGGSSLFYDKQGKTFAQRLLSMKVSIPKQMIPNSKL